MFLFHRNYKIESNWNSFFNFILKLFYYIIIKFKLNFFKAILKTRTYEIVYIIIYKKIIKKSFFFFILIQIFIIYKTID